MQKRVKHIIIGVGVVGKVTGIWLESHGETVLFNDINATVMTKLKKEGHQITLHPYTQEGDIIYWICVHEDHVEDIVKSIKKKQKYFSNSTIIIRSTTPPGTIERYKTEYKKYGIYHMPEFLRQNTALEDIFNPDRIIVGGRNFSLVDFCQKCYPSKTIVATDPTISELIKLVSNAWLSTQIAFWNEIKKLCEQFDVDPQEVANGCTLDKRISKYGSKMIGYSIGGNCLPKDLKTINKIFESDFFKVISKRGEE